MIGVTFGGLEVAVWIKKTARVDDISVDLDVEV